MNRRLVEMMVMGPKGWNGFSMGDVLGIDPKQATPDHLKKLGWTETLQLFHAAITPDVGTMDGEFSAEVLDVGLFAASASFITHNLFGPGRWLGKGFKPLKENEGMGYNIFAGKNGSDSFRVRKMNTSVGISNIDARDSFHINYSAHNKFAIGTMRDEIRKVNDQLYIGLGYMWATGGPANPAPFMLVGNPTPWVGPD